MQTRAFTLGMNLHITRALFKVNLNPTQKFFSRLTLILKRNPFSNVIDNVEDTIAYLQVYISILILISRPLFKDPNIFIRRQNVGVRAKFGLFY